MIFFIVKREDLSDKNKIKEKIKANVSEKLAPNNAVLISWNEVFEDLNELKSEILKAVANETDINNKDKDADVFGNPGFCRAMLSQAKELYGMDFSVEGEKNAEIKAIIYNHLLYWAHPLIGNIANSPNLRPHEISQQYRLNWNLLKDKDFIGAQTLGKIDDLFKLKIDRSGRDQVRICQNIYELARAFYGEVTSCASRRLEKLLALKLCQSAELYKNQCAILQAFCDTKLKELEQNITKKSFKLEYCDYYFQGINGIKWALDRRKENADTSLTYGAIIELIRLAIDKKYTSEPYKGVLTKEHLDVWTKLPPTIRCAILINDLRKCFANKGEPERMSMTSFKKGAYKPSKAADKNFLPALGFKGGNFLWSWNRDETHQATKTYRYYLCPLWAGPSGHTHGGLRFWKEMLGAGFDQNGCAITIASSLFIFWRLYFDKRISANHTLTETFEATWCEEITGEFKSTIIPEKIELFDLKPDEDAFQFISYQANLFKRPSVDPITLFMHLRKVYFRVTDDPMKTYKNLKTLIDEERISVSNAGYWLPQWSRELSEKQGKNVQSFAETLSGNLSGVLNGILAGFELENENIEEIMSYIIRK